MSTSTEENDNMQHHDDTRGNGFLASGLAWVDKQREKRRQEKLQIEAEKQLQKIAQAERPGGIGTRSFDSSVSDGSIEDCDGDTLPMNQNVTDVSKSGDGVSVDFSDVILNDNDEEDPEEYIPPVQITKSKGDDTSSYLLNADQMHAIAKYVLPQTISYCRWRRLYGLERDGDSFDRCIRIIGSSKRTLMVVKTTRGEIFGGYVEEPWHSRDHNSAPKFYGSASSALFSFSSPSSSMPPSSKRRGNNHKSEPSINLHVYRWTGKNRYIQVCDPSTKMLAFGGGGEEGMFGLCLQEDFQRGTTGHCDTFDNDPLCEEGNFDVLDIEVWEFLVPF